ncbi:MAG: hypothetical protein NVSMB46_09530 [Candidatus Saccharimonadales bacterium]
MIKKFILNSAIFISTFGILCLFTFVPQLSAQTPPAACNPQLIGPQAACSPTTGSDICGQSSSTDCVKTTNDASLSGKCSADYTSSENCGIIKRYLDPIIVFLSSFFGILITIIIIVGGIQYSSAGGDPQKVANAKKRIYNAIFALIAFLLLFGVLNFVIPGGLIP